MTPHTKNTVSSEPNDVAPDADDPVLAALGQVGMQYRKIYAALHKRGTSAVEQLDEAREEQATLRRELDREHSRAERHRAEARALATALKDVHRSIFGNNVYESILKACLALTGATRGVYLTTVGQRDGFEVRAAIDVNGYPGSPPSKLLNSLSRAALDHDEVLAYNDAGSFPEKPTDAELFRNCLVAPVVLRNDLSGVIIVADKPGGGFEQSDGDILLSVGSQAAVAIENSRLQHEVQEAYLSIVAVLADTMAARSHYADSKLDAACRLAILVSEHLALPEYDRSIVYYATLLRDIGNIGVSDGVLNKPGPLLDPERDLIRAHVQIGHDLLRQIPLLDPVASVVRHHHERFDGSGYPDGLRADDIPLAARIVSVVDAYYSMLAPRTYRVELSSEVACDELRRGSGTQFDPRVVDAFLSVVGDAGALVVRREPLEVPLPGLTVQDASGRDVVSA